ncbi:ArsC family reductase [Acetobacteraceae bacterium H6797]|nr:ArsC family reductase [Acetobacteraceae bacterium H6797]
MTVAMFGIKNCDTVKKARTWLEGRGIAYTFHDYKSQGITRAHLAAWCQEFGWEKVLNRAGTTFKKLPEADRENLTEAKAIALMLANPSMIKRPMLELSGPQPGAPRLLGFTPQAYEAAFK